MFLLLLFMRVLLFTVKLSLFKTSTFCSILTVTTEVSHFEIRWKIMTKLCCVKKTRRMKWLKTEIFRDTGWQFCIANNLSTALQKTNFFKKKN